MENFKLKIGVLNSILSNSKKSKSEVQKYHRRKNGRFLRNNKRNIEKKERTSQ
jgi:hypothetical protein